MTPSGQDSCRRADGYLWADSVVSARLKPGTVIGMSGIKSRRLNELQLDSHPGLFVGQCAPFYFCPRSVMLYLIYRANHPELSYRGGQEPIVHLECDLYDAIHWADAAGRRWAFTLSNAGSYYFEDRCDAARLDDIRWDAVGTNDWSNPATKEAKQAEFLVEESFPWALVERIGVYSVAIVQRAASSLQSGTHRPPIEIKTSWYY
ncbi:MAG: DUF4433 domain-containing protein [Vulcanimicrobiaceae bacterium]